MSQQCSWPTHSWPLEGRCLYYALLGLTQAPGFAGGPDLQGGISTMIRQKARVSPSMKEAVRPGFLCACVSSVRRLRGLCAMVMRWKCELFEAKSCKNYGKLSGTLRQQSQASAYRALFEWQKCENSVKASRSLLAFDIRPYFSHLQSIPQCMDK